MKSYALSLQNIEFAGPTNFETVIRESDKCARMMANEHPSNYTLLIIFTDGCITDKLQTVRAIIEANSAPLSIVIVGIGHANFSSMKMLDSDDAPLKDPQTGKKSHRDIVQFVEFNKFKNSEELASEVLHEIPD